MIAYILGFEKYATMNSWNGSYGYSLNVKIPKLPLTQKQRDTIYEAMDTEDFYDGLSLAFEDANTLFSKHGTYAARKEIRVPVDGLTADEVTARREAWEKSGYTYDRHIYSVMVMFKNEERPIFAAGFNGMSGGHLVLYKWNGHNMCGTGWTHDEYDLNEMTKEEVAEVYSVLVTFRKVYEQLLDHVRYVADTCSVKEEEYTETKQRKVLVTA